jgi:hypothetical protein
VAALLLAQSLPKQTGGFEISPTYFIVMFGVGFMIGAVGHLVRSRTLVALGVALIFLATIFIPVYLQLTH